MLNSYMLPHGARSTEAARAATPPSSTRNASTVRDTAIRPYRSPCSSPPWAPGPSGRSRAPDAERTTTSGRSSTVVPPPSLRTVTAGAPFFAAADRCGADAVSAAAVRPTLLRLPSSHSAMYAKNASV